MSHLQALKKLEEQLNCSVCLDTYTNPKQLLCNHVYCQRCLARLVVRDQQGQLSLSCPICRQDTPVPTSGVAGLPSAFYISHLLEIRDSFKKAGSQSEAVIVAEDDNSAGEHKDKSYCALHAKKELELYCETCGEVICSHCALKGGQHSSHEYLLLDEAFERFKVEIVPSLEPMEKLLAVTSSALEELGRSCAEITEQRATVQANIQDTIRKLQEMLEARMSELIYQLDEVTQSKLKRLAVQKDQIETTQAQLNSCLNFVRESLEASCKEDVLRVKTTVVKQIQELTSTFQQDILKPSTGADITFLTTDLASACCNYGDVTALGSPHPPECHLSPDSLKEAIVGEKSGAILNTINFKGKPCEEPIQSVECSLVHDLTGNSERCSIERTSLSQYEISYQCSAKGRYLLSIKIDNQEINGSPFSVRAKSTVEKLGDPILTLREVNGPWGVALNSKEQLVVAECGGQCFSVFDTNGTKLASFRLSGAPSSEFKYPRGIAVDGDGNILLVDSNQQSLMMFSPTGKFLREATDVNGKVMLGLLDVAFNSCNGKVYATSKKGRVEVMNSDLTYFGKIGGAKGQLNDPWGITCDNSGNVFVADIGNSCIQVFTAEGKLVRKFGRNGKGKGELNWPAGIAVDADGLVYVSEYNNCRISVFTHEGAALKSFGREGDKQGMFVNPIGLAVDSSGMLYVCDSDNNRVQIF